MVKNLLKYSLAILLMIVIFAAMNPSQGMEEEISDNKPTNPSLLKDNEDVLKITLFYRGLDRTTLGETRSVCKQWNRLISQGIRDLNHIFFTHLSLAPEFPYELIHFSSAQDSETKYEMPKNIETFSSRINSLPHYHSSLCQYYMQLNPMDFRSVALASYIIKKSSHLFDCLLNFSNQTPFNCNEFRELIRDPRNFIPLKKYLMALKLLGLSDHEPSKIKIDAFEEVFSEYYKLKEDLLRINPLFLHEPLWSTYTLHTRDALKVQYETLSGLMSSTYAENLNLDQIENLGNYIFAVQPWSPRRPWAILKDWFYQNLETAKNHKNQRSFKCLILKRTYETNPL